VQLITLGVAVQSPFAVLQVVSRLAKSKSWYITNRFAPVPGIAKNGFWSSPSGIINNATVVINPIAIIPITHHIKLLFFVILNHFRFSF